MIRFYILSILLITISCSIKDEKVYQNRDLTTLMNVCEKEHTYLKDLNSAHFFQMINTTGESLDFRKINKKCIAKEKYENDIDYKISELNKLKNRNYSNLRKVILCYQSLRHNLDNSDKNKRINNLCSLVKKLDLIEKKKIEINKIDFIQKNKEFEVELNKIEVLEELSKSEIDNPSIYEKILETINIFN